MTKTDTRRFYGPIHKAVGKPDADTQKALEQGILTAIARFSTATDGTVRLPSAYAEIVLGKG